MAKICQIILIGMNQLKLERGIIELGANKIIILSPNKDKYYKIARSIAAKYDAIADTDIIPILDDESFTFTQTFKQLISENFREYEIKINASTDVRNWKVLAYFSIKQFYPYLQEESDNRIMFYEVIGGDMLELSKMEYVAELDDPDTMDDDDFDADTDINSPELPKDIEADKLDAKDVLKDDNVSLFDDSWGKPSKRPLPRIEIYPIDTLTSTEQYIVDIIVRQELTIEQIKGEYSIICEKYVTDGLLSRYLGGLKHKAIVTEERDGRNKLFRLTEYGLKYVLPIIKEGSATAEDPYANLDIPPWEKNK